MAKHTEGLTTAQIWARPSRLSSVGFHLRHIAGSTTRLMAYAQGRQLDERQLAELEDEKLPLGPALSRKGGVQGERRGLEPKKLTLWSAKLNSSLRSLLHQAIFMV